MAKEQNQTEAVIEGACKKLFFTTAIPEMCRNEGTLKQVEYLKEALERELTKSDENRRMCLVKRARFPVYKTFEWYSYNNVQLPPALTREELENVNFIRQKQNLVLYGPVGIGKTHMAIVVGIKAYMFDYKTRFYTVTELVLKLAEARKNGTWSTFGMTLAIRIYLFRMNGVIRQDARASLLQRIGSRRWWRRDYNGIP